ncbi:hypothetical protein R6Q57_000092 [Mikania cordata]
MGPWGGNVGNYWDDGVHSGFKEIRVVYNSCMDSIRLTYDNNGQSYRAIKHGGIGGTKTAHGHCGPVVSGGFPVIRSLTFKSNQRTFGPFGVEEGTRFNVFTDRGQILGFYERSGWFLIQSASPHPPQNQK